ncbi:MAG: gfo/Idh/MocA family oxidoreductase, partial [Microbacterium sp.]
MTGLRWGILATGHIAHTFATDLRDAGIDLVAVGSRTQES